MSLVTVFGCALSKPLIRVTDPSLRGRVPRPYGIGEVHPHEASASAVCATEIRADKPSASDAHAVKARFAPLSCALLSLALESFASTRIAWGLVSQPTQESPATM